MFGPNAETKEVIVYNCHHREEAFLRVYRETKKELLALAQLSPDEWEVLLFTGSGTAAIEATILSVLGIHVVRGRGAEFGRRIANQIGTVASYNPRFEVRHDWTVQYETAESICNEVNKSEAGLTIVDGVSAFPYYAIPPAADIYITVSSKQLGALPGLALIFVRKTAWSHMLSDSLFFYANLSRYRSDSPPHTPAMASIFSLHHSLTEGMADALQLRIERRKEHVDEVFKSATRIGYGPVATFKRDARWDELIKRWGLYARGHVQLFLWSGEEGDWQGFLNEARRVFQ